MESRLQKGTFIYKTGFLVAKCALHLQNGILALQTGSSDCNSSFVFFYNKIFCLTFDETFAKATGTKTNVYNFLTATIIAVIIVLAMNLVGSLLISALIIFPALSAMRIFKSFCSVTICSAILSTFCATIGMLISILSGTPVGSTIVAVDIVVFFISVLVGSFCGGKS